MKKNILDPLGRFFTAFLWPIRLNGLFFAFMYLLGVLCAYATLREGRGAHVYEHLYAELFVDVYAVCTVLALIPRKVRIWVRGVLAVLAYAVALADTYCFVKFDSTLTPTMLLLVGETNSREAGEFMRTLLSADVVFGKVGGILLLALLHVAAAFALPRIVRSHRVPLLPEVMRLVPQPLLSGAGGCCVAVLLVLSAQAVAHNKAAVWKLMSGRNIGEVEHTLTEPDKAVLFHPAYRLAFSIYANSLTARQVDKLIQAADKVRVDSCCYRTPNIVLVIGESLARHHSQLYGYPVPTTPRQLERERSGRLVKYSDVVAPWNLTSFVFKYMFSMHVVGQEGEWCDYPLFPELFRKAGYHVTFLTDQFLPKAKEAVYDFSGGFFLNNPKLSEAQFDTRNSELHAYDEGLLADYDSLCRDDRPNQLVIFHLIGQHVNYRQRSPKNRKVFGPADYEASRPDLTPRQRRVLSDYDNSVLYNDSVVDQVCRRFEDKDAVVIYLSDHGEECYEGRRGFICRNHSAEIDYDLARYEFAVPFWIWCSHPFATAHPEIYRQIVAAKDRRLMTDALPHLLLYLAGIGAPDYNAAYNVLSPGYNEMRPRILKGQADYDRLQKPVTEQNTTDNP